MLIIAQIFLLVLVGLAMGVVVLRYRQSKIGSGAFILWFLLWVSAAVIILFPNSTMVPAKLLGLGRGTDLILYLSIIVILYLIFRVHVRLEQMSREITRLVRTIALQEAGFPPQAQEGDKEDN